MFKRNSPDTNKASTGCVRETPQIKIMHSSADCKPLIRKPAQIEMKPAMDV